MAIAPEESGDFTDGTAMNISTMSPEAAALAYHWNIKTAGVYRVVININTKRLRFTPPKQILNPWLFRGYGTIIR